MRTRISALIVKIACAVAAIGIASPGLSASTGTTHEIDHVRQDEASRADIIRSVLLDPEHPGVLVVSHRGHHRANPENSLAAIDAAIRAGAHVVEIDVRTTADGHHVLMHDTDIKRTTNSKGKVEDLTLESLRGLRLRHNIRPTHHRIPTLEEAFAVARGRVMLNIDPKGLDIIAAAELARDAGMLDHCIFKQRWSKVDRRLADWLADNPDAIFMPICESQDEIDEALEASPWPAIEVLVRAPDHELWTRRATDDLKRRGVRPWINTLWDGRLSADVGDYDAAIDPEGAFGAVADLGWGMIQTDLPGMLTDVLRNRGLDPTPDVRTPTAPSRTQPADLNTILSAFDDPNNPRTIVIAHRGHTHEHPENSLAAIDAAFDLGADAIEIDARTTGDGHLVLMHDSTVDRTTTGKGKVTEMTLDQLRALRLKHGTYPTDQRVLTLSEMYDAIRGRGMVYVDMKDADVRRVVDEARNAGVARQVILPIFPEKHGDETMAWLAQQDDVHAIVRARNEQELDRVLAMGDWSVIRLVATDDAVSWWPRARAKIRADGSRLYGSALKNGYGPGALGDRQLFETGPEAVFGALAASGAGVIQTDLPDIAVPYVREHQPGRLNETPAPVYAFGRELPPVGPARPVTVMSYNVRFATESDGENAWAARRHRVNEVISRHAPDVLAIQEPFAHQVRELLIDHPRYAAVGTHRLDGRVLGEGCVTLYDRARFAVAESGVFWLSDTPDVPASITWDNAWPRLCAWSRLIDLDSGEGLYVYNVHLDNKGPRSRLLGAKQVMADIEKRTTREHSRDPVVVCGDLNDVPSSMPLRALTSGRSVALIDPVPADQARLGTYTAFDPASGGGRRRIDYVLSSGDLEVLRAEIDRDLVGGLHASDHLPVVVTVIRREPTTVVEFEPGRAE